MGVQDKKSISASMKAAEQSVHWTLGILRDLQAFFWLRVFSAPKQSPRPPQRQYRLLQLSRVPQKSFFICAK